MSMLYADIIVDISHESLDRTFQYKVPDGLLEKIAVGDRVVIPFGSGNRTIAGFVMDLSTEAKIDVDKIKEIVSITNDDFLVEQKLIQLAYWIKRRYGSTMNQALKVVLPVKKPVKNSTKKIISLAVSEDEAKEKLAHFERRGMVARYRLLKALIEEKELDQKLVTGKLNVSTATIKAVSEMGLINVVEERKYRNTVSKVSKEEKVPLLYEQQLIVDDFVGKFDRNEKENALIFGVTGSGKTEVYMEMIEHVVKRGKSCIVLIPEIALTFQTCLRFYKRFGDRVSTLHSRLSEGERYDQFERARKHEIDIMIGPRSALFTPFDNLGLIVIDEEHENSYKSDQMPKYHAREVAIKLADIHGASVVMGSATPDISSFYEAKNGQFKLYTLMNRAKSASLPKTEIVDLRQELNNGNKSIFSESLKKAISDRLIKNEQIMLFLNRRGFAGFVSCRSCGEAVKCPHCDVALTQHKNNKLVCHYCGYEQADVKLCPKCGSKYVGGMRAGTEAVEEQIKKLFPQARVLRMDKDTTKQKDDYESILSAFANREADILVGTQMIVKGHDFPYVTLVGILAADLSLNGADYRAPERTYQLLVQAAGRAGRDNLPGKVIIQTYQPEHYAILAAQNQNYESFYEEEVSYRSLMGYPPMGHMLAVLVESEQEENAEKYSDSLAVIIKNVIMKNGLVIGPAPATVKKISDIYRFVIYIKSKEIDVLVKAKDEVEDYYNNNKIRGLRVTFDLDPVYGY